MAHANTAVCDTYQVNGGDEAFLMTLNTPLEFGGTVYDGNIFVSPKGTVTFGQGDYTFWDFPQTPSISIGSYDYHAFANGVMWGAENDLYVRYGSTATSICVDWKVMLWGQSSGEPIYIRMIAEVNPENYTWTPTYQVSSNAPEGARYGLRYTQGGEVVPLTIQTITSPPEESPVTPKAPFLNPPTGLVATANEDGSVYLEWNAPEQSNAEVERYAVSWSTADSGWGVSSLTTSITLPAEMFSSAGGFDVSYSFTVRADNDSLEVYSSTSEAVVVTPMTPPPPGPTQEEIEEAERIEAERIAAEQAALEAAEEEARLEAERIAAEQAAAELVAAEEAARLEAERLEAERLEAERVAALERAERERQEALAEAERLAAIEAARAEAERLEAERIAAEEAARLAAEESDRLEEERLEAERLAKIEAERLEAELIAAEEAAVEKAAKEEADRAEALEKAEAEEQARLEAEEKAGEEVEANKPTPESEPTEEPTPTEEPVVVEIAEPITAENIEALVEELATIAPQDLTTEQQGLIAEAALETFETAEQGSAEYESALYALLVVAQADDIVVDEELAAIPLLGNAAVAAAEVFNALGNAGADMSPQVREQSEKVVIASVIVANIAITATQAAASAAVAAARRP